MEIYCNEVMKTLPINNPIISTYPDYGHLFSMIDVEDTAVMEWVFSNFKQILTFDYAFTAFRENYYVYRNCPYLQFFCFPPEIINSHYRSLKEFIIESINNDYYVTIPVDYYFIKSSKCYLARSFEHPILIYGYDKNRNIAFCSDNDVETGKYGESTCSLDDFDKAYECCIDRINVHMNNYGFINDRRASGIGIYKRCKQGRGTIDINFLKNEFITYLEPQYMNLSGVKYFNLDSILCDEHMSNNEYGKFFDKRVYNLFYEHKVIMELRVKYLLDNSYLSNSLLLNEIVKLKNHYLLIRKKVMKYNINQSQNLLDSIKHDLILATDNEKNFMEELISELHNHEI